MNHYQFARLVRADIDLALERTDNPDARKKLYRMWGDSLTADMQELEAIANDGFMLAREHEEIGNLFE